ncbi:MAG: hypothetical protein IJT38_01690, partial [Clostridia bacterium]|nr:hypothetical protein [Clostridia bacterium]
FHGEVTKVMKKIIQYSCFGLTVVLSLFCLVYPLKYSFLFLKFPNIHSTVGLILYIFVGLLLPVAAMGFGFWAIREKIRYLSVCIAILCAISFFPVVSIDVAVCGESFSSETSDINNYMVFDGKVKEKIEIHKLSDLFPEQSIVKNDTSKYEYLYIPAYGEASIDLLLHFDDNSSFNAETSRLFALYNDREQQDYGSNNMFYLFNNAIAKMYFEIEYDCCEIHYNMHITLS